MLPSHVQLEDLRATISQKMAQLSSRPSDSPEGFLEAMFVWVSEWMSRHVAQSFVGFKPFAFVFHEADVSFDDQSAWLKTTLFRESYSTDIGGRLYLTTSSMLTVYESAAQHLTLEDLAQAYAKFSFNALPSLVVDPAHNHVHYCPGGVENGRITLSLSGGQQLTPVTIQNVDKALVDFHQDQTQYPEGCVHCFDDRKQRVLRRDAEAMIRDALFLQLRRDTFKTQYVTREEQLPVGRTDISIWELSNTNTPRAACVLELKVLRSRGTTRTLGGKPRPYDDKAMRLHSYLGLSQARKYKKAMSAELAYLVCFDGRDNDTPQTDVENLCQQHGVLPRRFYMHTSTRDDLVTC